MAGSGIQRMRNFHSVFRKENGHIDGKGITHG